MCSSNSVGKKQQKRQQAIIEDKLSLGAQKKNTPSVELPLKNKYIKIMT